MKKIGTVIFSSLLVLALAACGNNEETATTEVPTTADMTEPAETPAAETPAAEETPATETAEAPAATSGTPTAAELISKAEAATKELKSYNMVADVSQTFSLNGEENTSQTTMNTDLVLDPVSGYQEISTGTGDTTTEVKQYITPDAIYMEMNGAWTKLPEEQRSQVMAGLESASNLENSFEQFKSVAEDMKVTEEGDDYVLTASLSGEKIKAMAADVLGGADEQAAAAMEQMNIEEMNLTYAVNKETSYPTKSLVDMTMSMESGEGDQAMSMSMNMVMDSTISKHNEIEAITVPQEVIDGAQ